MPAHGQEEALERCLKSIINHESSASITTVVVDDGSATDLKKKISGQFPLIEFIRSDEQLGFTRAVSIGLKALGNHTHVILLNSDMQLVQGCCDALIDCCSECEAGIVGGMEISASDPELIVCAGTRPVLRNGRLSSISDLVIKGSVSDQHLFERSQMNWVPFGIVMITRECFESVGELDPRFLNYFSDADFCLRAGSNGYSIWFEPAARVLHEQHLTSQLYRKSGVLRFQADREKFIGKWVPEEISPSREHRFVVSRHLNLSDFSIIPHVVPGSPIRNICMSLLSSETQDDIDCFVSADKSVPFDIISGLFSAGILYHKVRVPTLDLPGDSIADRNIIVFAPHADDAGLSIGGYLRSLCYMGTRPEVHVIFGRSNFAEAPISKLSRKDITQIRMFEEEMFCAEMGADSKYHLLPDSLLRGPSSSLFVTRHEEAPSDLITMVAELLERELIRSNASMVMAPLSVGGMVDHAIVFGAVLELFRRGLPPQSVVFYEDIPYVSMPNSLCAPLQLLSQAGYRMQSSVVDVSPWFEKKTEELSIYFSQMTNRLKAAVEEQGQIAAVDLRISGRESWRRAERLWRIIVE